MPSQILSGVPYSSSYTLDAIKYYMNHVRKRYNVQFQFNSIQFNSLNFNSFQL